MGTFNPSASPHDGGYLLRADEARADSGMKRLLEKLEARLEALGPAITAARRNGDAELLRELREEKEKIMQQLSRTDAAKDAVDVTYIDSKGKTIKKRFESYAAYYSWHPKDGSIDVIKIQFV